MESIGQKGELPHCTAGRELQTPPSPTEDFSTTKNHELPALTEKDVHFIFHKNFAKPATPPMRNPHHPALLKFSSGFLFKITPPKCLLLV